MCNSHQLNCVLKKKMLFNLMMMLYFRRLSTSKTLPPRPPPAKTGPGRPPPPNLQAIGRSQSAPWEGSPKPQTQKPGRKGPVLPPRPNPGHRLYNKYTVREIPLHACALSLCFKHHIMSICLIFAFLHQLQLPHGIAASDYNGSNTGELSFQVTKQGFFSTIILHIKVYFQVKSTVIQQQ